MFSSVLPIYIEVQQCGPVAKCRLKEAMHKYTAQLLEKDIKIRKSAVIVPFTK
jgi:hypothetical protein